MIIKSIELNNIRSYKSSTIEFENGINFLSGDIGSGKSSILLAIEFALFGFKRGDLEGYQLLRKGEKEGFVKLTLFDPKNSKNKLEIFRKIKRGKTIDNISQDNGYIKHNNNLEELSPQELNAHIFNLLNFPKEFLTKDKNLVYRFTIYTPQEQLKEVLYADHEKRLEIIRKIFRIDKYKQLITATGHYLSDLKVEKKVVETKQSSFDNIELELSSIKEELSEKKGKLISIQSKEDSVLEQKDKIVCAQTKYETNLNLLIEKKLQVEKNISTLEEIKNVSNNLVSENSILITIKKKFDLISIQRKKDELNSKIKLIKVRLLDISKQNSNFNQIKSQIDLLLKQKEKIQIQISELNSNQKILINLNEQFDLILTNCQIKDNGVLINKSEQKLRKAQRIKQKYEKQKDEILKQTLQIDSLNKEIEQKTKFMSGFETLETCPTCIQKVDKSHTHKITSINQAEITKLKTQINDSKLEIKTLEKENKKLLEQKLELEQEEKILIKLQQIHDTLQEKYKFEKNQQKEKEKIINIISQLEKLDLKKTLEKLNLNLEKHQTTQNDQQKQKEIELKLTNEISELNNNLSKLDLEIQEQKNNQNKIKENQIKLDKYQEKLKKEEKIRENQVKINDKLLQINAKLTQIKEKLEITRDNEKKISNIKTNLTTEIEFKIKQLEEKTKNKLELEKFQKQLKTIINKENFLTNKITPIAQNIEKTIFTKYYVEFNEIFEKLFKQLIEDNEIDVRLNEVFSIIVEQNGFDIDIKNLSGGEKSSLAIAYRLGLKQIIENNLIGETKLDLLILDEPTDGFSNDQIDRLGNILKSTELKQTILVSHDEKIASISDNIIHIEKVNHVSKNL